HLIQQMLAGAVVDLRRAEVLLDSGNRARLGKLLGVISVNADHRAHARERAEQVQTDHAQRNNDEPAGELACAGTVPLPALAAAVNNLASGAHPVCSMPISWRPGGFTAPSLPLCHRIENHTGGL